MLHFYKPLLQTNAHPLGHNVKQLLLSNKHFPPPPPKHSFLTFLNGQGYEETLFLLPLYL